MIWAYFEIVWKLRSSCVSGIHGDEDSTGGVQPDLCPLKHEHRDLLRNGSLYGLYLLGYHRQHLKRQDKHRQKMWLFKIHNNLG